MLLQTPPRRKKGRNSPWTYLMQQNVISLVIYLICNKLLQISYCLSTLFFKKKKLTANEFWDTVKKKKRNILV